MGRSLAPMKEDGGDICVVIKDGDSAWKEGPEGDDSSLVAPDCADSFAELPDEDVSTLLLVGGATLGGLAELK